MKTVIHTWVNNYFGLGDLLRGTIKLYQLSKKLNFVYIVDIQHHPIYNFLVQEPHGFSDFVKENVDKIPLILDTESYILNSKENLLYFVTNDGHNKMEDITEDCKDFIKKLLTPNREFSLYIEEKKKLINFPVYNILHFRLGDYTGLISGEYNYNENAFKKVKEFYEENDVLISDNKNFKKYVVSNLSIFSYDIDIAHLCHHKEIKEIKDTIFEFFLLTGAKKIKTYSVYDWISGFVHWASKIYDIELIIIP